ncbi:MAG: RsmB/NOP family class I SAM-dependent RNA methyltransferase [Opitutae bacterium]|nr:RsmB/NOP family class I SAM-dependent RNA methyltransferase [Opitutae bacterium]
MNPRIAANQQRTFLAQLAVVLPHVRTDSALPRRIKDLLGRNRALGSRDRRLYRELIYTVIRYLPWLEPLLTRDENVAAQLAAWLAPEMKDTSAYRAALLEGWPATPPPLAEKSTVLRARFFSALGGRASRPDEPPPALAKPDSPSLAAAADIVADIAADNNTGTFAPAALLPAWFREHCPDAFASAQLDALLARAPIWIRLQANDRAMVLDEFRRKSWEPRATPVSPDAFALPPNAEVANTDAYRRGFVEIQDLGSQLVLAHAPVHAGERWLDACAGAGGKTLQLAHAVGATGRVDATDIRPAMLEELRERATRARLTNVHLPPAKLRNTEFARYDGVLVDAPCSGSGTWRRLPHMKWHTRPETIPQFAAQQLAILSANAAHVRPGGLLVYATCSLSHVENHDVAAAFLAAHPEFSAEKPARDLGGRFDGTGTTLLPATHDSDGFYVALLRRQR